ncbi:3-hydroxyacyl-CoA dehydrogenase family protein [Pseudogemmobacter sonorensis]|uniref:3-hydroxyacyl-CoA dehydrogenase family protein n=1 Tax=Pseudogemmobacter sonorensis TaxID=2989681 RepID=UPI00369C8364
MDGSVIIAGAGIMGRRLARHFLRARFRVALIDPAPQALEDASHFIAATQGAETLFTAAPDLAALGPGWRRPRLTIEAVPEDLALKRAVLAGLEAFLAPDSLIASNTSGLTTAALGEGMRHPERLAIAHFFNPADVVPVVELVAGPAMPRARLDELAALLRASGKIPAVLGRELPGFIANRIQHALMRECFHLVAEGVADPATIDDVIRYSIGVRLALSGPFEQRDLNGLDTHLSIADYLYRDLAADTAPPPLLKARVAEGALGKKAGRGFYRWDAARKARAARKEQELDAIVARSRALDADDRLED